MKKLILSLAILFFTAMSASAITQSEIDSLRNEVNMGKNYYNIATQEVNNGNWYRASEYNNKALYIAEDLYKKISISDFPEPQKTEALSMLKELQGSSYFTKGILKLYINPNDSNAYVDINRAIPLCDKTPNYLVVTAYGFAKSGNFVLSEKLISSALTANYLSNQAKHDLYKLRAYIRGKYLNNMAAAKEDYIMVKSLQTVNY